MPKKNEWPPGHEKAPDTDLNPVRVENIVLKSRYGKSYELGVLRVVVFDLLADDRKQIKSLDFDSSADVVLVTLQTWPGDAAAEELLFKVEGAILRACGGHSGLAATVEHSRRDHHVSLPGEMWRDPRAQDELSKQFRTRWPAIFDAPLPLKVGIFADLIAAFPDADARDLKLAISAHCRSEKYLKALAGGGKRFDLDGKPSGEVTPEQIDIAARMFGRAE